MATESTKCKACGARVREPGGAFCSYCGTRLPEIEQVPPISVRPLGDLDRRFYELERHPSLPELMDRAPSGGSDGTNYFVTLEYPEGNRKEYVALGALCGEVTTGDVGVAYLRDDLLLDFERVRV